MKECIALIPARSGSKRIKNKNIKLLSGHPLVAYSIITALKTKIFSRVIVSTDNEEYAKISRYYGAEVPFLRPVEFAADESPDIYWLKYSLKKIDAQKNKYDYFSILRPTSPFRSKSMILKAWEMILEDKTADSVRAVERCSQHPAKMWFVKGKRMTPVIKNPDHKGIEWYSTPLLALPGIFVQNSSLEIAKSQIPLNTNSIAGENIIPYLTVGFEGYDLNTEKDWIYAEYLLKYGKVRLPEIGQKPYKL